MPTHCAVVVLQFGPTQNRLLITENRLYKLTYKLSVGIV